MTETAYKKLLEIGYFNTDFQSKTAITVTRIYPKGIYIGDFGKTSKDWEFGCLYDNTGGFYQG